MLSVATNATALVSPVAILTLCVLAGIGTFLLLPGRAEASIRKIGGALLIAVGLILMALIAPLAGRPVGIGAYFWIFSSIAIVSAVRVVTHRRPVYSALYFVLTVFASAGLFVLMYAEFMAAALVIIYAGAILVTYVFVIMLAASVTSGPDKKPLAGLAEYDAISREPFVASCIGFALMGVLLFMIFDRSEALEPPASALALVASAHEPVPAEMVHGSTQSVGLYLFTNQAVSLELAGLILTVSMVGAIVIARRRVVSEIGAFEPVVERLSSQIVPLDDSPSGIPVYGTTNPRQKAFPQN